MTATACSTRATTAVVGGTDTTDANGFYSFEGLAAGSYIVQINESQFQRRAQALDGLISVIATSADPDDNVDNDDNGIAGHRPGRRQRGDRPRLRHRADRRTPTADRHQQHARLRLHQQRAAGAQQSRRRHRDLHRGRPGGAAATERARTRATVTDANNPNFNGGSLTASVSGGTAEDQLSFLEDAIVDIDGSNIVVDLDGSGSNLPTIVGTVTGLGTANLVVTFNANATSGATGTVSALLQHLTYFNSNTLNPPAQRSLTVSVDDGLTGVAAADLLVNITDVNDAPDGTDTTVTGKEDTDYIFTTADFGFGDVDGNSLFAVKITTLPGAGVLTNNGSTVLAGDFVAVADITGGLLKYTPPLDAHGDALTSFTFQVQDDSGDTGSDLDPTPNTLTINVELDPGDVFLRGRYRQFRPRPFPHSRRRDAGCDPGAHRSRRELRQLCWPRRRFPRDSAAICISLPTRQAISARSSSSATPES